MTLRSCENMQLRRVRSLLYRRIFRFLLRYRVDLHEISRFSKEKLKNSQRKRKKNWVENRDFWVVFLKKNNVKLRSIRSPLYEQLVQKLKYPRKQLGELYKMVPFAGRESEIRSYMQQQQQQQQQFFFFELGLGLGMESWHALGAERVGECRKK